jgi:YggT family protein
VIIRAVVSWFSPDPFNPLVRILNASTDPLLRPVQKYVPALGGIDWSPLVLIFVIMFLQYFLVNTLGDYAMYLRLQAIKPPSMG